MQQEALTALSQADIINLKKFRQQMIIEQNLSSNTILSYISDIKQFLLFHTELPYQSRIHLFLEHLSHQQFKSSSILRKFTAIKQYCKFLDIFIEANLPKIQTNMQITHYQDILTLIQHTEHPKEKAFVSLLFATGGRISEILSLKLQSLQNCIHNQQNHFNLIGKGRKERIVFLTEQTKLILDTYIQSRTDKNPYLFPARLKSTHISRQWGFNIIQQLAQKLRMPTIHPHSFRHAQAMMLLESGADLISIQKILGHAHLSTTERYLKLHWRHLLDGISKHPLTKILR